MRDWRRPRRARRDDGPPTRPQPGLPLTGRYCAPGPVPGGHIPFTPLSKKILGLARMEAAALDDAHIGVEHIVLALTRVWGAG